MSKKDSNNKKTSNKHEKDICESTRHSKKLELKIGKSEFLRQGKAKTSQHLEENYYLKSPKFLRNIGPKQIEIFKRFIPSKLAYTFAFVLYATYLCEWRDVLQYLPYYNGKYKETTE